MLPMPMNPITTFSLGGTFPLTPNTDDGTMYGKVAAPNAVPHTLFKNCRRFITSIPQRSFLLYQSNDNYIKNKFFQWTYNRIFKKPLE